MTSPVYSYAPLIMLVLLLLMSCCCLNNLHALSEGSSVINIPNSKGYTLSHYLCGISTTHNESVHSDVTYVLQSNTTHSFNGGNGKDLCIVNGTSNITIRSSDGEGSSFATINCSQNAGLGFTKVSNLRISNVHFIGCGGGLSEESVILLNQHPSSPGEPIQIPYPDFNQQTLISLLFIDCPNLSIHGVTVSAYNGFGIIVKDIPDTVTLSSVSVTNAVQHVNGTGLTVISIANAENSGSSESKRVQIHLSDIAVTNGWTDSNGDGLIHEIDDKYHKPVVRVPAGMTVIIVEPTINPPNPADIVIKNLTVYNNSGGGMIIMFVNIVQSTVSINHASISGNCLEVQHMVPELDQTSSQELIGESLTVYYAVTKFRPIQELSHLNSLVIRNTEFTSSESDSCRGNVPHYNISRVFALPLVLMRSVGVYVGQRSGKNQVQYINLSNVSFAKDFPGISFKHYGMGLSVHSFSTFNMTLHNVTSSNFRCIDSIRGSDYNSYYSCVEVGSLAFTRMRQLYVVNGIFTNHKDCSVFYAQEANTYFTGNITIDSNQGVIYGAVQLVRFSRLFFQEPLTLVMTNNQALYGAALYVYEDFSVNCALQFIPQHGNHYDYQNFTEMDVRLLYGNNRASLSGNTIYGNLLHHCGHSQFDHIVTNYSNPTLFEILRYKIHPLHSNKPSDIQTQVSSPPNLICLCSSATNPPKLPCDKDTDGYDTNVNFTVYPGEQISLYLLAGDGSASVFGVATARLRSVPPGISVDLQHQDISSSIEATNGSCTKVDYRIYHNVTGDPVNITLELAPMEQLSHTVITLILKSCPPGLQLNQNRMCDCLPVFRKYFESCSVDGVIQRPDHFWIGYTSEGQYGFSWSCPDGFCNDLLTNVSIVPNLTEGSPMCNGGRTGTLCASCPTGKSVVFGSIECMECSNWYLFTILFFGLCGIVLVALLFVLQLTIKIGTINGVIFYANLLASGFTTGYLIEVNHNLYLLKLFVAFLNLNLGFPLCFYNGMTEEIHHLLEFVFPVYVWVIIGLIIYASKHSIKLSKLTGQQSVAVLATLIQLSYSNIMSNVASSIPFAEIMTENSMYYSWFSAGGVRYGSAIHIVHMVISLLFLLIFILPYTFLLTLAPFAGRYRIVSKLMPYLDVIYAPYKEKWRCWFGLRLCLLVVLLVIQASLSGYSFKINLGAQVVSVMTFTLFQVHYKPFKNLFVHFLDVFYMLNFCFSGFLAISLKQGLTLQYSIIILISSSFIVFLSILAYHFYMVFLRKWVKKHSASNSDIDESDNLFFKTASYGSKGSEKNSSVMLTHAPTKTVFDQLREPILDYADYTTSDDGQGRRATAINHSY